MWKNYVCISICICSGVLFSLLAHCFCSYSVIFTIYVDWTQTKLLGCTLHPSTDWSLHCSVQLQAAENEKVRWELEKTQLQQNIEENKERMMKLESYWIEAQTLCHTVNEHLKETQSQYQALEKKYNKAKKLIKDFQQK